jgi:hypothetical protein
MSAQAEVHRLAIRELDTCPRLDELVNNAGGSGPTGTSPPAAWSTPSRSTTSRRSC